MGHYFVILSGFFIILIILDLIQITFSMNERTVKMFCGCTHTHTSLHVEEHFCTLLPNIISQHDADKYFLAAITHIFWSFGELEENLLHIALI